MAVNSVKAAWISFWRRVWPIAIVFLAAQTLIRITLAILAGGEFIDSPADVIRPFVLGVWFDLVVLCAGIVPLTLYWVFVLRNWRGGRLDAAISYGGFAILAFVIGFTMVAEYLFWLEFGARLNFIAVDYLVYTQEVVGNIRESYHVIPLLAGVLIAAIVLAFLLRKFLSPQADGLSFRARVPVGLGVLAALAGMVAITNRSWSELSSNVYANELSANGYYTLVDAFFHNEIDYRRFYRTEDEIRVGSHMRELLANGHAKFTNERPTDITHDVISAGPFLKKNVILVTMESMSGKFMAHFGNKQGITPNLDRLADEGIFFTNLLATGTRTVRGLEAVTLSLPPTPGQSIVRRPKNDDLFSLGSVLRDVGYETSFVYGGYGIFDNMNGFYEANGYRIVDRARIPSSEVTFANVWGICDEDLFKRVVHEADAAYAAGRPFLQQVMTVSNHRPFTYPDSKIDIPSFSGREGGVKYADYAIGRLIELSKTRDWFKDTLFVFVADHTASSAGKIELDPLDYHIPAIFYAPGFVQPRKVDHLVSQIDIPPTILGLLRLSYRSRFIGEDQVGGPRVARAFVSNYQKLAFIRGNRVAILAPKREVKGYVEGKPIDASKLDASLLFDAITYYQFSSRWKERFARIDSVIVQAPLD